jgi:hypothetical protein
MANLQERMEPDLMVNGDTVTVTIGIGVLSQGSHGSKKLHVTKEALELMHSRNLAPGATSQAGPTAQVPIHIVNTAKGHLHHAAIQIRDECFNDLTDGDLGILGFCLLEFLPEKKISIWIVKTEKFKEAEWVRRVYNSNKTFN